MRAIRFAAVALLGLPLGGCFGVTLPSQPVPDWAMSPQVQYQEPAAASPRKQRAVRRSTPPLEVSSSAAMVTGEVSSNGAMVTGEVSATPQAPALQASALQAGAALASGPETATPQTFVPKVVKKLVAEKKFIPEEQRDPTLRQTMSICRGC